MEEAENSEGFDSCEEIKSDQQDTSPEPKRSGNPFLDFNIDILAIQDEDEAMSIKIGRKMIVDYIERSAETDF